MKKLIALILCLILLCSCASAPVEESSKVEESESASSSEALNEDQKDRLKAMFADTWADDTPDIPAPPAVKPENYGKEGGLTLDELEEGKLYVGYAELLWEIPTSEEEYCFSQGSAYDGEYYYTAFRNQDDTASVIAVSDENGNVVRYSEPMYLAHANSMTYVEKDNALYVAHCTGGDESEYYTYSVVDKDTFEIKETIVQDYPMTCFAYCEEKDMFYSAEWGGEYLDIWDSNFEHIANYSAPVRLTLSQGCYATEQGFWYARSPQDGWNNEMVLYDWEGNLVHEIVIPNFGNEFEDIAYMDEDTVIIQGLSIYGYGAQYYEVTFYEQP